MCQQQTFCLAASQTQSKPNKTAISIQAIKDEQHIAGVQRRAPDWIQRLQLEWLYRLVTQPWRWRRQLALPKFALAVVAKRVLG